MFFDVELDDYRSVRMKEEFARALKIGDEVRVRTQGDSPKLGYVEQIEIDRVFVRLNMVDYPNILNPDWYPRTDVWVVVPKTK